MTKILCFSASSQSAQDFFKNTYGSDITIFDKDIQDYESFSHPDQVEVITAFTDSILDQKALDQFPNLKHIATQSTGFNHIDLEHCDRRGIVVSNVPVYGANTVAEYAFSMLLALSRKVFVAYEQVRADQDFRSRGTQANQGFDLEGKTIGIIGTGNIGQHAIRMAYGFGMKILAFDLYPNDETVDKYGVEYVSLEQIYQNADIISYHVPYNKHTHHLFNRDVLPMIKDTGVIIINTSRGAVLSARALKDALDSGKVVAAGLDVLEYEGMLGKEEFEVNDVPGLADIDEVLKINHELINRSNVIVTPHNAFNTVEAIGRIWDTTVENIDAYLAGQPKHVVEYQPPKVVEE